MSASATEREHDASIREKVEALLAAYRDADRASLVLPALGSTEGWYSWLIGPVGILPPGVREYREYRAYLREMEAFAAPVDSEESRQLLEDARRLRLEGGDRQPAPTFA